MEFTGNEPFKRKAGIPEQSPAPKSPETPINHWVEQSRDLIDQIDNSYQLQETLPGVPFAEDMKQLLDPSTTASREKLVSLLNTLYNDLTFHEFTISMNDEGKKHIHMAHETSIPELGNLFKAFSQQFAQFPVPGFDSELVDKKKRLVEAFKERGRVLAGE